MIHQPWIELQVAMLNGSKTKSLLGRERLRLTKSQITFYLMVLWNHQIQHVRFSFLYRQANLGTTYAGFMKNVTTVGPLMAYLFEQHKKETSIDFSSIINSIDTTLLAQKRPEFITQKDWAKGKVTIRSKNKVKTYICGQKGLVVRNRQGCIVAADLLKINHSDFNILKNPLLWYRKGLDKGFLLADRGFNSKKVRKRFSDLKANPLLFGLPAQFCFKAKLLSPPHVKELVQLSPKERRLYKRRWKIESLFQELKDSYNPFKLDLTGARTPRLVRAKFFVSCLAYNLSKRPV